VIGVVWGLFTPFLCAAEEAPDTIFSRGQGPIEILMFTDYFCPPCRSIEPYLEKSLAELNRRGAKIAFVDKPIHAMTPLYSRYFLYAAKKAGDFSEMLHIRHALFDIASTQNVQSERELAQSLKAQKITYVPMDVTPIFDQWAKLIEQYEVKSTPTCIVKRPGQDARVYIGGRGIPEGIVAPQSAATASVGGAMIPLLTLGVPGSGATAVMLGAFLLHGIQPGPQVFITSSHMVYTVFASLFLGILLMCVVGYFAIKPLVKILDFPEAVVSVYIMLLCFIGALSIRNSLSDLWLMVAFGMVGYLFDRIKFPIAPLVLGTILGPLAETSFLTTMISFQNDWTIFFRRPISGLLMVLTVIALIMPMLKSFQTLARRR
jgi:thiol-disulfide isomerase/thioredoxin